MGISCDGAGPVAHGKRPDVGYAPSELRICFGSENPIHLAVRGCLEQIVRGTRREPDLGAAERVQESFWRARVEANAVGE